MLKRVKQLLLVALCCVSCAPAPKPLKPERWVAYYDDKLPASAFLDYDLLVFDREYHPPLAPLKKHQRTVLAYVSVGEIHGHRAKELAILTKQKAILEKNDQWDSQVVDLTSATWRGMVMKDIKNALDQGFDGVMLDTLDMPLAAAKRHSDALEEANKQAAIQLVNDIRETYPEIKIMLNRGFAILSDVSGQLDFILAESILSETNVSTGQSLLFSPKTYRELTGMLHAARRKAPKLKIYTLDYWKPRDVAGIRQLYAIHREHGFIPYVTTPDLRTLSPEPHSKPDIQRAGDASRPPGVLVREEPDA